MMCDWPEKVSLLVDGELSRAEAASVEAHLEGCPDCRAARGEFLSFRRQLSSYRADVAPAAQRRALETILASRPGPARREAKGGAAAPRLSWHERVLAALGVSPFRPAAAAALALLLATAAGLALYLNAREESRPVAQAQATPAGPETNGSGSTSAGPTAPHVATDGKSRPDDKRVREAPPAGRALAGGGSGPRKEVRRPPARHSSRTVAAGVRPPGDAARVAPPDDAHGEAASTPPAPPAVRREMARAGLDTARHVEQAQMLLRSFRNARRSEDLADERERSRRLLYRNIVLRREAASKGDPLVASVLNRLEPILIDIANLPDRPAPGDVDLIRERVRKKNLVVALQAGRGNAQVASRQ